MFSAPTPKQGWHPHASSRPSLQRLKTDAASPKIDSFQLPQSATVVSSTFPWQFASPSGCIDSSLLLNGGHSRYVPHAQSLTAAKSVVMSLPRSRSMPSISTPSDCTVSPQFLAQYPSFTSSSLASEADESDEKFDTEDPWNLIPYNIPWGPSYEGYKTGSLPGPEGASIFLRSPTPLRLQRTEQACQKCRERKAKCTGARPACARCVARDQVCVYGPEVKRAKQEPSSPHRTAVKLENDDDIQLLSPYGHHDRSGISKEASQRAFMQRHPNGQMSSTAPLNGLATPPKSPYYISPGSQNAVISDFLGSAPSPSGSCSSNSTSSVSGVGVGLDHTTPDSSPTLSVYSSVRSMEGLNSNTLGLYTSQLECDYDGSGFYLRDSRYPQDISRRYDEDILMSPSYSASDADSKQHLGSPPLVAISIRAAPPPFSGQADGTTSPRHRPRPPGDYLDITSMQFPADQSGVDDLDLLYPSESSPGFPTQQPGTDTIHAPSPLRVGPPLTEWTEQSEFSPSQDFPVNDLGFRMGTASYGSAYGGLVSDGSMLTAGRPWQQGDIEMLDSITTEFGGQNISQIPLSQARTNGMPVKAYPQSFTNAQMASANARVDQGSYNRFGASQQTSGTNPLPYYNSGLEDSLASFQSNGQEGANSFIGSTSSDYLAPYRSS